MIDWHEIDIIVIPVIKSVPINFGYYVPLGLVLKLGVHTGQTNREMVKETDGQHP